MISWLSELEERHPVYLGRAFSMVSAILQATLNFASKRMENMDGPSISYVRSLLCIMAAYIVITCKGISIWPQTEEDRRTHFIRMLIGGSGIVMLHTAVGMVPLQVATVVIALNTPINVVLLIFLGKYSPPVVWVCVMVTFLGVIMVVDPSMVGLTEASYDISTFT